MLLISPNACYSPRHYLAPHHPPHHPPRSSPPTSLLTRPRPAQYDEAIDLEKTDKLMAKSAQMGKAGEGGSFITVHPQGMMDTGTMTPQVEHPSPRVE